jgi:hypothetical protein
MRTRRSSSILTTRFTTVRSDGSSSHEAPPSGVVTPVTRPRRRDRQRPSSPMRKSVAAQPAHAGIASQPHPHWYEADRVRRRPLGERPCVGAAAVLLHGDWCVAAVFAPLLPEPHLHCRRESHPGCCPQHPQSSVNWNHAPTRQLATVGQGPTTCHAGNCGVQLRVIWETVVSGNKKQMLLIAR